jgi:hypothetical protein
MALTRSFKELVQKRVGEDPAFGAALLREGIDTMLSGDVDTGKAILRDTQWPILYQDCVQRSSRLAGIPWDNCGAGRAESCRT